MMDFQPDTVRQMAAAFTAGTVQVDTFLHAVCHLVGQRLGCNRVTVWRFEGPPGLRTLHCVAGGDLSSRDDRGACAGRAPFTGSVEFAESEYRDYFAVLVKHGYVESADVRTDPRLRGLLERYLQPCDIRSLLDVGFSVNGRTVGILCCGQVGELRRWQPADVATARRVGATISLALTRSGAWEAYFPEDMPLSRY
jgi:GAF domain-containing protein